MIVPGSVNPLLLKSAAAAGGLQVSRSLRFNASDSAYLSRVVGTASNRKTWTWAAWVKRSQIGTLQTLFGVNNGSGYDYFAITLNTSDSVSVTTDTIQFINTAQVFRDTAAWMHLVFAVNTADATASDRIILYVNGTRVTSFANTSYPTQNTDLAINSAVEHGIGRVYPGRYFDGYLANIHFIDGQQLTPASFAETDATTGQWIPKAYSGSYGTNGFNLLFADNSSNTATTLGKDTSGLGNNWTPNNLSVTAGAGNDSLVDSPTNGSQTDTGVGGEVRGNYCTINPLDQRFTDNGTISNGNLDYVQSSTGSRTARCSIGVSSGKWYWEFTHLGGNASHGISKASSSLATYPGGGDADGWSWFAGGGIYNNGGTTGAYSSSTYTTNDVIGVALDLAAGTLVYYKNGVSQGTAASGLSGTWFPAFGSSSVAVISFNTNFGQRPFAYTAPSGFKALCTQNLPAPLVTKSNTVFDVITYTGTGSSLTLPNGSSTPTSIAFTPDFVWLKGRSGATDHAIYDSVRDVQKDLVSNSTAAETTQTTGLTAFGTNTFTVGSLAKLNTTSATYVGWAWDAGTSTVSNPDGSITSQVRANPTAGFSVVTYTVGSNTSQTMGHGLGVAPQLIIVKERNQSNNWFVYHNSIGNGNYLSLNTTTASTASNLWNSTSPTSTVFTIRSGGSSPTYDGRDHVAYCFSPVVGYSSFGSYTGNGSADGPFVYTGFRPRYILWKQSSSSGNNWDVMDTATSPYNVITNYLSPDKSDGTRTDYSGSYIVDILSNGFKLRAIDSAGNGSGSTYIYAAFAEMPFNYSRAR